MFREGPDCNRRRKLAANPHSCVRMSCQKATYLVPEGREHIWHVIQVLAEWYLSYVMQRPIPDLFKLCFITQGRFELQHSVCQDSAHRKESEKALTGESFDNQGSRIYSSI